MEKAVEHSRNNARKFGTEQFGNMVLNLYQKEVWRGEYERNESIALCEKTRRLCREVESDVQCPCKKMLLSRSR